MGLTRSKLDTFGEFLLHYLTFDMFLVNNTFLLHKYKNKENLG